MLGRMQRGGAALRRHRTFSGRPIVGGRRFVWWLAPAIAAAGLSACASFSEKMAGTMSELPAVGLPADSPARPSDAMAFPAVHDMPPPRTTAVLTGIEQKKFEDDLLAARKEQQKTAGTAQAGPKAETKNRKEAKKEPKKTPPSEPGYISPSSSRLIY
jgi:hypothetical protein